MIKLNSKIRYYTDLNSISPFFFVGVEIEMLLELLSELLVCLVVGDDGTRLRR